MPYKIVSPTGVSITKTLSEEEVNKLKAEGYFEVVSMKPRITMSDSRCVACEG